MCHILLHRLEVIHVYPYFLVLEEAAYLSCPPSTPTPAFLLRALSPSTEKWAWGRVADAFSFTSPSWQVEWVIASLLPLSGIGTLKEEICFIPTQTIIGKKLWLRSSYCILQDGPRSRSDVFGGYFFCTGLLENQMVSAFTVHSNVIAAPTADLHQDWGMWLQSLSDLDYRATKRFVMLARAKAFLFRGSAKGSSFLLAKCLGSPCIIFTV